MASSSSCTRWCFSSTLATPRSIRIALVSSGSGTCTTWKRRVSAGSFSMYFLYSAQVVAPMVRRLPRASAGLSRLAASPVPAAPPAPTSVWISSMNRMIGVGELCTSSITWRRRCSNSPFMLAPACKRPMSSVSSFTSFNCGGTSPRARRCAKPSTTAVLPTPASPVSSGLFWRRRMRMSTIWRISSSRPVTGSISPFLAFSVRSTANFLRASPLPMAAGAMAPESSPGAPLPMPVPSWARICASGEASQILGKLSARSSTLIFSNCFDRPNSGLRRLCVFSMPTRM
ncbi:hypothetical protein D9M72_248900 [compost metagenome]